MFSPELVEFVTLSAEVAGALSLVGALVVGLMFKRYEIVAGVAVLVGATLWHATIVDRWGKANLTAEDLAVNLKYVPMELGDWKGVEMPVPDDVKKKAGAVGHISRVYANEMTGDQVDVWLAVGHARDICRHTPDSCYPSQGYHQQKDEILFTIPIEGDFKKNFWTSVFSIESGAGANTKRRVFWAWAVDKNWVAPAWPRVKFGNTKGLYKLYFTNSARSTNKDVEQSPSVEFAKLFLPIVNDALFGDHTGQEADDGAPADEVAPAKAQNDAA